MPINRNNFYLIKYFLEQTNLKSNNTLQTQLYKYKYAALKNAARVERLVETVEKVFF